MPYRLEVNMSGHRDDEIILMLDNYDDADILFHHFLNYGCRPVRLESPQGTPLMSAEDGIRRGC